MSANSKEIYRAGHLYRVTRRFLPNGKLRVRVTARRGFAGDVVLNEFRDYADMHEGDRIFAGHINKIENN